MAPKRKIAATTPTKTKAPTKMKITRTKAWKLLLYVAGQSPKSIRAFANLKLLCDTHLEGRYRIEVIDLLEHPHMARGDQIVATPTLVIKLPTPVRQIIGDLSNTDRVLVGLALHPLN